MSKPRVLFFIDGPVPTLAEREASLKIPGAAFRNSVSHTPEEALEKCEAVCGNHVPKEYLTEAAKAKGITYIDAGLAKPNLTLETETAPPIPPTRVPPRATLRQNEK